MDRNLLTLKIHAALFVESDQWECLTERSRQQLQRSLATMETDSRPDLKDKAQTMRRKIQALP